MKTLPAALIVVLIYISPQACAAAEADGFRGLTWGTEFSTVKDTMTFVRTDPSSGGVNFYKRADEEMQIGDGNLTTVEYGFWQDQLSNILITFTGFQTLMPFVLQRKPGLVNHASRTGTATNIIGLEK
jgi:hypothetical protein